MQFVKIATAAVLAMGVTGFAVAQERTSPTEPLNRSAPAAKAGSDHDTRPSTAAPSNANPTVQRPSMDMNSGATGSESRPGAAQSAQITEKNVGPMLQAQGYTDVKSIKRSGDTISANAKKDGKNVKLKVDSKTGKVNESRS